MRKMLQKKNKTIEIIAPKLDIDIENCNHNDNIKAGVPPKLFSDMISYMCDEN